MDDARVSIESTTPLAGNATKAGATLSNSIDSENSWTYSSLRVFATSDVIGTVSVQQSVDGTTWFTTVSAAVVADSTQGTIVESLITLTHVRAYYVNGAGDQASFLLVSTRGNP